jgi:hypothetical protein
MIDPVIVLQQVVVNLGPPESYYLDRSELAQH